jgi:hypothetical protein
MTYSLEKDGDVFEQNFYTKFIRDEFPSYEAFWVKYVVPLTNRPINIHTKTNSELASIGKSEHDICISQLHYTVLLHLVRVYEIRQLGHINIDQLIEGMVRLIGAQDVAFELMERVTNPRKYDPWGETIGKKARSAWQKKYNSPLQTLRAYRNHLVHGRVSAQIRSIAPNNTVGFLVPAIGKVALYLDWRKLTGQPISHSIIGTDYVPTNTILDDAWKQTIQYFEQSWQDHLL